MRAPDAVWETTYRADRRQANHRCRCCARVLAEGDAAVMTRVSAKTTWAIHAACGSARHGLSEQTWRDAMTGFGLEYLRACGWRV